MVSTFASGFIFIAQVFISALTTLISYVLIDVLVDTPIDKTGPCAMILIISYIVGSAFIQSFDDAANTILQCYLIDKDVYSRNPERCQAHIPESLKKFIKNLKLDGEAEGDNTEGLLDKSKTDDSEK